ncbi:MAG: hypothetical protein QGG48_07475 [Desulfatiglandales bacterium]|jgi:creatinine amidohydrolase|nr:hypothetical protein [Desulfatiglandales bacterium]
MMHYFPEQVNSKPAKRLKSTDLNFEDLMEWRQGWTDSRKLTPLGYFGDPASFDPRIGEKNIENYVKDLAYPIGDFINGDYRPPEIK